MSNKLATTFALSAAALFLSACGKDKPTSTPTDATAAADAGADKKVRCYGANECAGQTACDVKGKWKCAGNNDCCGKGWIQIAQSQCDEIGGGTDESAIGTVAGLCEGKGEAADADAAAS